MDAFDENEIQTLNRIVETRRTIRSFRGDAPPDAAIKAIIHAGASAPHAALAIGDIPDFRRFFVFRKGSANLAIMNEIIKEGAKASIGRMVKEIEDKPSLKEQSAKYLQRLGAVSQGGYPGMNDVPCFIVVAEHRGTPSAEKQSLAHVMQNMWLTATAWGLGFQLVSMIESLTEVPEFSRLLKLPPGEFAFNGCIVGYAAQAPGTRALIAEERVTTWL